jgi:hypothetical protein
MGREKYTTGWIVMEDNDSCLIVTSNY